LLRRPRHHPRRHAHLADLGYEGEADTIVVVFKKHRCKKLGGIQQQFNRAHNRIRAVGERGNSPLGPGVAARRPRPRSSASQHQSLPVEDR
jgi:hypothetical protein